MKTNYLLIGLALAGLTASCSKDKDSDITYSDKAISFTAAVPQTTTRALTEGVTTTSTLNNFRVYSFVEGETTPFMNGVEVNKTGNLWTYSPVQFWPVGKTLNFYAYSPQIVTNTAAEGNIGMDSKNPDIPGFINGYKTDLLYAVNMDQAYSQTTQVKINFRHALARLSFKFKAKEGQSIKVKISNVNLVNTMSVADFKFPRESTTDFDITKAVGKWSNHNTPEVMLINSVASDFIGSQPVLLMSAGNQFVLPQEVKQASEREQNGVYLRINATIYDADSQLQVWPREGQSHDIYVPIKATDNQWKLGYLYAYTISVGVPDNEGWIQFDKNVTVDEYGNIDEPLP